MTRKLLTTCCALLLMAAIAQAQDSTHAKDGADYGGGMPPMGPPAELKQIESMLGTWKADFEMRMEEGAPWTKSPATLTYTTILDGAAYQGEFSTSMMGQAFNGIARITYNRTSQKWQTTWVDNMGAYQALIEGTFSDSKLVLTGSDSFMGKEFLMRETYHLKSATEMTWTMEMSHDNGENWYANMKGDYTKQ